MFYFPFLNVWLWFPAKQAKYKFSDDDEESDAGKETDEDDFKPTNFDEDPPAATAAADDDDSDFDFNSNGADNGTTLVMFSYIASIMWAHHLFVSKAEMNGF